MTAQFFQSLSYPLYIYTYNRNGQVTAITNPVGGTIAAAYVYDGNGNLVFKTDVDGDTAEYTYNGVDLVTKINYNDAKQVSYRRDAVGTTGWSATTTHFSVIQLTKWT